MEVNTDDNDDVTMSLLYRPVAGYVNLCPESVSTKPHDIHQMHSTIKHEILHALVSMFVSDVCTVGTYNRAHNTSC